MWFDFAWYHAVVAQFRSDTTLGRATGAKERYPLRWAAGKKGSALKERREKDDGEGVGWVSRLVMASVLPEEY